MGGGGKSSSTTTTNTTNTSGTSAISGDNLGVVLSGVNDSDIEIDMRLTDHGAIESAEKIAGQALESNNLAMKEATKLGSEALQTTERVVGDSLGFAGDALKSNENVTKAALESSNQALESSLAFGGESLAKALDFGSLALKENSDLSGQAMDNMRQNSADTVAAVKAMAAQSGENARAALLMAENTAARSQTGSAGEMSKVAIAVAVVAGVGLVAMAFKGGR